MQAEEMSAPIVADRVSDWEEQSLSGDASSQGRFLIRQGAKGWMVYDRERKGPAHIGPRLAANLTMEEAEHLMQILKYQPERNTSSEVSWEPF
ncbi:hypothetical protein Q2941_29850 [Bradyrhizobium sp. UFLA05-153]